jgi:hypothetical protein
MAVIWKIELFHVIAFGKTDRGVQARENKECQRARGEEKLHGPDDGRAVEAVGGLPGRKRQEDHRDNLNEADEAERKRGVFGICVESLIDFPADRHGLHLHGQREKTAAQDEIAVIRVGECRVGI